MPLDGRFVWGAGHMHDGAIKLVLRNVTDGKRVLVSRALYPRAKSWFITGVTTYRGAPGIRADEGDVMRVTAVYDSTRNRRDVMGNLRSMVDPLGQTSP